MKKPFNMGVSWLLVLAVLAGVGSCLRRPAASQSGTDGKGPVPVCHLLVCCRANNQGTTFLVNGAWNPAHDYSDIDQVRDILRKVKDAGIRVVGIDFTNPPEWEMGEDGPLHLEGVAPAWDRFRPMLENIAQVCGEEELEYFLFIGNPQAWTMKYWNTVAGYIWEHYAQDPAYRHYGFGDDRPLLVSFFPGESFWALWDQVPEEEKDQLSRFRIGTCQVNDPITATPSDGWGYRNISESSDGAVRFCCPNSGVAPADWARVDAQEWKRRVKWALGAKEYAVFGSYDDTCDAIMWGICDVSHSTKPSHVNPSTVGSPAVYYDILKEQLQLSRSHQSGL